MLPSPDVQVYKKDKFCHPSGYFLKNALVLHNVLLNWNVPIIFFIQIPSRREAKSGFFFFSLMFILCYLPVLTCKFPIVPGGFLHCSTKNQWPFLFLSLPFVLEIFLLDCWKLPCSCGTIKLPACSCIICLAIYCHVSRGTTARALLLFALYLPVIVRLFLRELNQSGIFLDLSSVLQRER